MNARERILHAARNNQPGYIKQPESADFRPTHPLDVIEAFRSALQAIGASIREITHYAAIPDLVTQMFPDARQVAGPWNSSGEKPGAIPEGETPDVVILRGSFGVAENGAIWITDRSVPRGDLPFACEHLVVMLEKQNIVATLHEAYDRIGNDTYHFGTFIAGPSRTADIEQSLVLGAHGPKTHTVLLI